MGRLAEFCSVINKIITKNDCTMPYQVSIESIRHLYPRVFKPTAEKICENIFYILYSNAIMGSAIYLCSSNNISDEEEQGHYEYYFGIDHEGDMMFIGYIYMYLYDKAYPNRVMFYTEDYQINWIKGGENVLVYYVNPDTYNMMINFKHDAIRDKLIDYLKNIDRQSNR